MIRLSHEMSFRELDVLHNNGKDKALAMILRSKGFPVSDTLVPSNGVVFWDDTYASRIFVWEGEKHIITAPPQPPEEKKSYIEDSLERTIQLEDD